MAGWLVVGISGVCCGGKTTLVDALKEKLPYPVVTVHQDDYFFPEDSDRHVYIKELNHANWDIISSIDMESLHQNVIRVLNNPPSSNQGIILIDGNLIFNFGPIQRLCHKKFYITLNKEICWGRRQLRAYDPPDPPGSGYFEACVWPMYEMYKKEIDSTVENVIYLDGSADKETTLKTAYEEIIKHFS